MAESNVPLLVDKTGGSYSAIAPKLKPGKFNKWKRRMLCYLVRMEPYYIKCIKEGPFQPKNAEGAIKPESQWTNDKRRVVNQDQRFKSIIMSCLPDDIMESVISSETAKATCTDLEFQENYDDEADGRTSEEYLKDLELESFWQIQNVYQKKKKTPMISPLEIVLALRSKETTKFGQVTFSEHLQGDSNTTIGDNEAVPLRLLQTEDDNDDEKRFQANLSRADCQSLDAFHLCEKPEERSWVLVTTATVMTVVCEKKIFEVKELVLRTVLMVDSITFGQDMVNILVSGKEYDKVFNHLNMLNAPLEGKGEYKKMKAKLALLETSPSTSQSSKPFQPKNKGLVAKIFDWDEEEVLDDEEMTQVKVLMALADDELLVGKNHARNSEWIGITIKKLNHALQEQLKEERKVNEKWLTSSKKVSQCISEQIPNKKKKILGGELLTESSSKGDVKENPFMPTSLDYDHEMIPISKDWVERHNPANKLLNFNTRKILVAKSKVVNECLKLTKAFSDPEPSKESGSEPLTP
ncbi:hypothetical protein Tco_1114135 [Tanacetum coccineum]|uniref:Retrovirus-related Pol polyprotein from transposon TNT 1-94 n=1 Tax=Tanacetum coccineum TaxID=301880 RepID=A0ABQ5IWH2_9ASTR